MSRVEMHRWVSIFVSSLGNAEEGEGGMLRLRLHIRSFGSNRMAGMSDLYFLFLH